MNAVQQFLNRHLTQADQNVSNLVSSIERQKQDLKECQEAINQSEKDLEKAKFMADNLRRIHDAELSKAA